MLPIARDQKKLMAQRIVHFSFRFFVWLMQLVGVLRIHIYGKEHLNEQNNSLLIANHPTLIDVVVLISLMKETDCIVKQALWKNPLLGGVVRAAGYISNSSPEQLLNDCVKTIKKGRSLIVFPEGTRTTPGTAYKFQRGAANIALRSGKDLLPATITCNPSSLTKEERWYQIPRSGPVHLYIVIKDAIKIRPFIDNTDNISLASRQLTHFLQDYYQKEVFANE